MPCHLARAIPRRLQELPVNQPHQFQVQRRLPSRLIVEPGPADRDQLALPHDRELGVVRVNHLPPPLDAHRPEALAKKSRSTTNWPILACSFSISTSDENLFVGSMSQLVRYR